MKSIVYLAAILFVFVGCNTDEEPLIIDNERLSITYDSEWFQQLEDDFNEGKTSSDSMVINAVSIENNQMLVDVSYSGGCKEHYFKLVWPEAIIAIYPPDFGIILLHDSKGDMCEAFVNEILVFDLIPNELGLNEQSIKDMRITVINGSDPDNFVSNR